MLVIMEGRRLWAQKEMGGRVGLAVWFRMCEKGVSFSRKNSVICKTEAFLVLEVRFFVKSLEIIATWCFLLLSSHFNQSQRLNSHSELFAETRHLRQ